MTENQTRTQERIRLQKLAIANALANWERKKQGIYYSHEKERHSKEYCDKQIEYFKNFKFK